MRPTTDVSRSAVASATEGNFPGTAADREEAVHASLSSADFHARGTACMARGDLEGAIANCKEAIRLDPHCFAAFRTLADCYHLQGDFPAALACCEEVLRINPHFAAGYHARAGIRLVQGDVGAAIADCDEAIRLDPQCCGAYLTRGNARYHKGDWAGVLDYRTAFKIDPVRAAKGLVTIFQRQLRLDGAGVLASCEKHLSKNPRDVMSYARRGLTLLLMGKEDEAQKDFDQFRLFNPGGLRNLELMIQEVRQRQGT